MVFETDAASRPAVSRLRQSVDEGTVSGRVLDAGGVGANKA